MTIRKWEQEIADAVRVLHKSGLLKWRKPNIYGSLSRTKLEIRLCFDEEDNVFLNFVDSQGTLSGSGLNKKDSTYFQNIELKEQ